MLDGSRIRPGDTLIGLLSDGLHTNGYSLARSLVGHYGTKDLFPTAELRLALGDELLRVHKNYQPAIAAIRPGTVNAAAIPAEASSTTCLECCRNTVRPIFAVAPGGCRRSSKSFSVVATSARSKCIRFLTWAYRNG